MKTRSFVTSLIVITCLLLIQPVVALASGPAQDTTPQPIPDSVVLLVPILVGSFGVPLVNWLKKTLGWTTDADKKKNIWLTFGVSLALAILALLVTQSFIPLGGPETVVTWLGLTFTVATLIYKSMQADPTANG